MQTATARDVAMVPPKCPTTEASGPYFQKEFFHNGYIKSLKQLVHFYNTRDVRHGRDSSYRSWVDHR
jgi:cytochrome c peroxidase